MVGRQSLEKSELTFWYRNEGTNVVQMPQIVSRFTSKCCHSLLFLIMCTSLSETDLIKCTTGSSVGTCRYAIRAIPEKKGGGGGVTGWNFF